MKHGPSGLKVQYCSHRVIKSDNFRFWFSILSTNFFCKPNFLPTVFFLSFLKSVNVIQVLNFNKKCFIEDQHLRLPNFLQLVYNIVLQYLMPSLGTAELINFLTRTYFQSLASFLLMD